MDNRKVARELVKIAKSLMARPVPSSKKKFVLKVISDDSLQEDVPMSKLDVVREGTLLTLNKWAKSKGYEWKSDSSLFGGYWADDDGTCYVFDIK